MANGDITHIKELGRFSLPGGGHTTAGVPKNNKVLVWGEIQASYVSTGIDLAAMGGVEALGVSTLDFITFETRYSGATAIDPTSDLQYLSNLAVDENKIFVADQLGASDPAIPSDGDLVTLRYLVLGDTNAVADLT